MDMSFSRVPMALTRRRHFGDLCPEEALTEGSPSSDTARKRKHSGSSSDDIFVGGEREGEIPCSS